MLSKQEIAGLRELLAAAAWTGRWYDAGCGAVQCEYPADGKYAGEHGEIAHPEPADAALLIVAMHNALPALLDIAEAVDRIRALITEWRGEVADIDSRDRIGDITFGLREQLNECANELVAVLPLAGEVANG